MTKKKMRKKAELDTETTFADMNIEGFRWYNPNKKAGKEIKKVSHKEYWDMVKGAFLAYLPMFAIVILVFALMFVLGYLWLM